MVGIAAALSGCSMMGSSGLPVGTHVPQTRLFMMNGETRNLEDYRGKTLAMVFWASWCPDSKTELRRFEEVARRYPGRQDLAFVAVSVDKQSDQEKLQDKIKDLKLTDMQHAFSGNDYYDEAFIAFKGDDIPHFYLIDPSGEIVATGNKASVIERGLKKS
jgi:peroxiredoxin